MDSVEDDIEYVENFLESKGIKPFIQKVESTESTDVHKGISDTINNPNLDLLVIDYLMPGIDGKRLIQLIRESNHVFLPVIFYSSAGIDQLMAAVSDAKLDGVYLANRAMVKNKLQTVITSLLRKEQTSKRTRGLLMEGVSEIDANLDQVLTGIWNKMTPDQRVQLIAYFKKKLSDRAKSTSKSHETFPTTVEAFWQHASQKFVSSEYDTYTRWRVLKQGFELIGFTNDSTKIFEELFNRQDNQKALATLRNEYGHQSRAKLEESHDEEKCISIRLEVRRQLGNLEEMLNSFAT